MKNKMKITKNNGDSCPTGNRRYFYFIFPRFIFLILFSDFYFTDY